MSSERDHEVWEGRVIIERVSIRNWQSLRNLDLELRPLTVIVGQSSSGKTALMRAFRAVASNVRGASSITRGAKVAAITVHTNGTIVTLERTATAGLYRLVDEHGSEQSYSKLAGAVPADVTRALRIQPVSTNGTSINFASQFDRPYLLDPDDSGARVARVLGELTNVTTIFEAVREANRRRTAHAGTLRTRRADLTDLQSRAKNFAQLRRRLDLCAAAEKLSETVSGLEDRVERLRHAASVLEMAETVLAKTAQIPDVPRDTAVATAQDRYNQLRQLLATWQMADLAVKTHDQEIDRLAAEEAQLHNQLHTALVQAGTCPTCGQVVAD